MVEYSDGNALGYIRAPPDTVARSILFFCIHAQDRIASNFIAGFDLLDVLKLLITLRMCPSCKPLLGFTFAIVVLFQ